MGSYNFHSSTEWNLFNHSLISRTDNFLKEQQDLYHFKGVRGLIKAATVFKGGKFWRARGKENTRAGK